MAKIDSTAYPFVAKDFNIEGFPTLILFRKGERVENYSGDRKAEAIVTVNYPTTFKAMNVLIGMRKNYER